MSVGRGGGGVCGVCDVWCVCVCGVYVCVCVCRVCGQCAAFQVSSAVCAVTDYHGVGRVMSCPCHGV